MTVDQNGLNADRSLDLSDKVARLESALSRVWAAPGITASPQSLERSIPDVSPIAVRSHIRARRLRDRYFEEGIFAEPAWDMMLDLFESELCGRRVAVTSLCVAAAVPPTTALRWIKALVDRELFVRRNDPLDGRRVFIELSANAFAALAHYFADVTGSEKSPAHTRDPSSA